MFTLERKWEQFLNGVSVIPLSSVLVNNSWSAWLIDWSSAKLTRVFCALHTMWLIRLFFLFRSPGCLGAATPSRSPGAAVSAGAWEVVEGREAHRAWPTGCLWGRSTWTTRRPPSTQPTCGTTASTKRWASQSSSSSYRKVSQLILQQGLVSNSSYREVSQLILQQGLDNSQQQLLQKG